MPASFIKYIVFEAMKWLSGTIASVSNEASHMQVTNIQVSYPDILNVLCISCMYYVLVNTWKVQST